MGTWTVPADSSKNLSLERAIAQLNPKAKQAMYGAARAQTIHKGTWNGCAFNAAGMQLGGTINESVQSVQRAAEVFDLPAPVVQRFISAWDALPGDDKEATEILVASIEKIGLFSEPGTVIKKVIRKTLYHNVEKKLLEELEKKITEAPDTVEGICEAGDLLFAGV